MAAGLTDNKAERALSCQLPSAAGQRLRLISWWVFWLLLMTVGLLLSQWQWQRADEKREINQARQEAESLYNPVVSPPPYSEITLTGNFRTEHSMWLDNRIHQGKVGVALLTPFIDIHGRWWLIDRGFVDTQGRRGDLEIFVPEADFSSPGRLLVITGTWQSLQQKKALVLGDLREGNRLQAVDLSYWPQAQKAFAGILHLSSSSDSRLRLERWWVANPMPAERHIGYSLQWFLLALLCLIFAIAGRRLLLK